MTDLAPDPGFERPEADNPDYASLRELEQYFRIERWSGMANKSPDQPLTNDERQESIEKINGYLGAAGISRAVLAKRCGLSASVVTECLAGHYRGDVDTVLHKIAASIEADCQRRAAPAPAAGEGFVETQVAREVATAVKAASSLNRIAAFWDESGTGKTMALRAVMAKDFPTGILIEVNEGSASPLNFLNALCRAASRRGPGEYRRRAEAFNAIVALLSNSRRMIVIDEADNLHQECFNIIRQIHDATGCPVVLAGRPPLQEKIKRTLKDPRMGGSVVGRIILQYSLSSRVVGSNPHSSRPLFSEAEVIAMLRKYRVRIAPSAIRFLAALANTSSMNSKTEQGALRYMLGIFEMAVLLAKGDLAKGKEVTKDFCRQALMLCRGNDAGEIVSAEADRYAQTRAG